MYITLITDYLFILFSTFISSAARMKNVGKNA